MPIKIGKGKSREIEFEIVKMVPRPQAIVDALAKLKAANATPKKPSGGHGGVEAMVAVVGGWDDCGGGVVVVAALRTMTSMTSALTMDLHEGSSEGCQV